MNVLILGATGMLGPHVVPVLARRYNLRITDIHEPRQSLAGEFRRVDISSLDQVMAAAEGMDAIINLATLRMDRKLAFDVNTLGCYNMMRAAVALGIRRVINTGPHMIVCGSPYDTFDFDITPDVPPQPGTNIYGLSKSLGQEICRTFTEHHDVTVQTYMFYTFYDPVAPIPGKKEHFAITWQRSAEIFPIGLEIDLNALPSRCESFFVFGNLPRGKFNNEKTRRILGFDPDGE